VTRMAKAEWRSADTQDTVVHKLLYACCAGALSSDQTVNLVDSALDAALCSNGSMLATPNSRNLTPADLAMRSHCPEVERKYTVIVFSHYQILECAGPLHRSPTAVVYECIDLRVPETSRAQQRLALKLVAKPHLWQRELEVRKMLPGSIVDGFTATLSAGVVDLFGAWHSMPASAVSVDTECIDPSCTLVQGSYSRRRPSSATWCLAEGSFNSLPGLSSSKETVHEDEVTASKVDVAETASAFSAMQYATSNTTATHPITKLSKDEMDVVLHPEARLLMQDYPYAVCMPLGNRNLLEIIQAERLAEEPMVVIRQAATKVVLAIKSLHVVGLVHGDIKPRNIVRFDRHLKLIDFDMAFRPAENGMVPHADQAKLLGSTAYAAPELIRWMASQEDGDSPLQTSPIKDLSTPTGVDLWSFAVTLYEMATSTPLFEHSYDRATTAAWNELLGWQGLPYGKISQIETWHGRSESAALVDLLQWALHPESSQRPAKIEDMLEHAFFNPELGSLRVDLSVQRIRDLLNDSAHDRTRTCPNVMISYCWADTDFVIGKLAPELAVSCKGLWLDRLGGDQGMGEWAVASMQRGVAGADVVVAVVSPEYVKSINCGKEMGFAADTGTTVLPIVLNIPFAEWPPRMIGQTEMKEQFRAASGDCKIFVDMTDRGQFRTKLNRELLPRLQLSAQQENLPSQEGPLLQVQPKHARWDAVVEQEVHV